MMKLKRIDGGMYCFLLTFDPSTEVVNIVDLHANSIGSLLPQPAKFEIQSADKESREKPIEQASKQEESPKLAREYRTQDLLSRREAAAYLGVSEQTLAIWKCTGRYNLPYLKVGRLVKYELADLDAYLERVKHAPESPPKTSYGRSRSYSGRKVEF